MTIDSRVIGTVYEIGNGSPGGRGAVYDVNGVAPTMMQTSGGGNRPMISENKGSENVAEQYRIRKLTPTETYRLMGWQDNDIQKVKDIDMSDTQMYRQAGNGICVPCVELLFEHLYKAQYDENYECYDETFLKALPAET